MFNAQKLNSFKPMAIKVKIIVRDNTITGEKVASARIVDLQEMDFKI